MSDINWLEKLGWNHEQIEDLRVVGFAYIRQGKYDIALSIFEGLTVLSEDAYDFQTLGGLYLQLGQPNKALLCFDKALKIDPSHPPTLLNLAKTFFLLGKKEEALKIINLLKTNPSPGVANIANALLLAYG